MNDLLEPFLIEARELIQSATEDLLALEGSPGDTEAVNRVFRAFHTLKGSVGLFDVPPLLAILHAAEDGLVAARSRSLAVDAALIDLSLETLDATARWTDAMEAEGILPTGAEAEAAQLAGRFGILLARQDRAVPAAREPSAGAIPDWAAAIVANADPAPPGARDRPSLRAAPRLLLRRRRPDRTRASPLEPAGSDDRSRRSLAGGR